jgi:hypothetical protein
MNHLISKSDLHRIEGSLIERRDQLVQATSLVFNLTLLVLVLSGFVYFLYVQYNSNQEIESVEKRIAFEPTTWYSATRNVRSEEYGRQLQPLETETRHGIPRPIDGGSPETLF